MKQFIIVGVFLVLIFGYSSKVNSYSESTSSRIYTFDDTLSLFYTFLFFYKR